MQQLPGSFLHEQYDERLQLCSLLRFCLVLFVFLICPLVFILHLGGKKWWATRCGKIGLGHSSGTPGILDAASSAVGSHLTLIARCLECARLDGPSCYKMVAWWNADCGGGPASLVDESSAAKVGNTLLGGPVTIFHVKNPYKSICLINLDGDEDGDITSCHGLRRLISELGREVNQVQLCMATLR